MRTRNATCGLAIAIASLVHAQSDQGVETVGPTYPITEPDLLEEIQQKLKSMEATGALQKKIDEAIARSTRTAQYPKPVEGLTTGNNGRTFYFDPTIRAVADIRDHEGKVIVKAGQAVNPLEYTSLTEWLLFFDGTDPRQVKMAQEIGEKYQWMVKPILTAGGPIDIGKRFKRVVYFDQGGAMVSQLGIKQVPALVTQDGRRLRIDELGIAR